MSKKDLEIIIATDCGSTTTKAILIEKKGDTYRQTFRGERLTGDARKFSRERGHGA